MKRWRSGIGWILNAFKVLIQHSRFSSTSCWQIETFQSFLCNCNKKPQADEYASPDTYILPLVSTLHYFNHNFCMFGNKLAKIWAQRDLKCEYTIQVCLLADGYTILHIIQYVTHCSTTILPHCRNFCDT